MTGRETRGVEVQFGESSTASFGASLDHIQTK